MQDAAPDFPLLNPGEVRVLGSLIEKKELTPDVYPMSLNGLVSAANQKTAREPLMSLETADIHRSLRLLEQKGLVRQIFASRVERYEHLLAQRFSLTRGQAAIIGLLMLRGPQTAYELLSRSERMASYSGIEELGTDIDLLMGRRHPLVQLVGRGPGQREDRYAHLLAGTVEAAAPPRSQPRQHAPDDGLEARVAALEEQLAALASRVEMLSRGE